MSVEPAKKIYEVPVVRREENADLSQRKKPRPQKKDQKTEKGKIDIKV